MLQPQHFLSYSVWPYYKNWGKWFHVNFKEELIKYYKGQKDQTKILERRIGRRPQWTLSLTNIRNLETTKHVHRLHPYKGKFIPQLVEYFLDNHTDKFKKKSISKKVTLYLIHFPEVEQLWYKPVN